MMNKQSSIEKYLEDNGRIVYRNAGESMMPLLRQNRDLIEIEKKCPCGFKAGDVVLYKRNSGQLVLHRIISAERGSYTLMGDNCVKSESGVTDDQILGVMTAFVRDGERVSVNDFSYRVYTDYILKSKALRVPALRAVNRVKRDLGKKHDDTAGENSSKATADLIYLTSCIVNSVDIDAGRVREMNLGELYRVSVSQMMSVIVATGLEKTGIKTKEFIQAKAKALRRNALLESDLRLICSELEALGIWYMPLKGAVISKYYPEFGMREMSDIDILFDSEYAEKVRDLMNSLGFETETYSRSNHDNYRKPPVSRIEMHRDLFGPLHPPLIREYYRSVKSHLIKDPDGDYKYHLGTDDLYIYIIAHCFKHYTNDGTGLRSLLDIYIFNKKFGNEMNCDYISRELSKMELKDFEEKMRELSFGVFSGTGNPAAYSEDFSRVYGSAAHRAVRSIKENGGGLRGRLAYIKKRLFVSEETAVLVSPFLAGHRILHPLLPVYRFGKAVRRHRTLLKSELEAVFRKNR